MTRRGIMGGEMSDRASDVGKKMEEGARRVTEFLRASNDALRKQILDEHARAAILESAAAVISARPPPSDIPHSAIRSGSTPSSRYA